MSLAAPAVEPPSYWARARRELARADPVMARLIRQQGKAHLMSRGDPFLTLARAIVGQQISVAAAATIWARFEKACGEVHPGRVVRMREPTLTRCGLSVRKVAYLRDLARRFESGALDPAAWPALDDEAVIGQLTQVHGVGRWTAEMFLIFNLLRPDVLPLDDIGLLRAIALQYPERFPQNETGGDAADDGSAAARHRKVRGLAQALAEPWRPWRSAATWYLWRSLDVTALDS